MIAAVKRCRELFLLLGLIAFVLLVNHAVISWNLMFVEQPIIYQANQTIHSFQDLLHIYLHPKLLDLAVIFFRPSGHFLLYQLLTPLLGWHNTKGLLIVNLVFLALTGYCMIKLYKLLFPGYEAGGYLAFAIYLMSPALVISRFTIMHFEFAYVFFAMLSCYYFVAFCQKNNAAMRSQSATFKYGYLFALAILFYMIAITFKEPAIMLGPILASYLMITFYHREPVKVYIHNFFRHKDAVKIVLILAIVSVTLLSYLTMAWISWSNPLSDGVSKKEMLASAKSFLYVLAGAQNYYSDKDLYAPGVLWRHNPVPLSTELLLWGLLALTLGSVIRISFYKNVTDVLNYKKSLVFILLAIVAFLILPIGWGVGMPWHASLALAMLGLALGFGADFFWREVCRNKRIASAICVSLALCVGLNTIAVNNATIKFVSASTDYLFYGLVHNAVFNPPPIKDKLNADSIIVVEDSQPMGDYAMGDGSYPFFVMQNKKFDFHAFMQFQQFLYLQYKPVYNGTLFSWAYLMPLREELYPFKIQQMAQVPDEIIYNWLQHYNNIFCLGYDHHLNWHDRTDDFKKTLLAEKIRRHLIVNEYQSAPMAALTGEISFSLKLPYADSQLCQGICDKKELCKGFTYVNAQLGRESVTKCNFYQAITTSNKSCPVCTGFIKT
jgi:hypothetical protein